MPKIELLNEDCMKVMARYPDKYFDLACCDPNYGIGEDGASNHTRGSAAGSNKWKGSRNTTGAGVPSTKFKSKEWDKEPPKSEYFKELFRVSKNQIIFGANHFIDKFFKSSSCWVVWDKMNDGSDFADAEIAYTSFKTAVRIFRFRWNGMLQGDMKNKQQRIHPTQKPIQLYQWLLTNYAKPGQKIIDTHLGSGSSAIAAHYFDVDFVGCEIDKDYYNAAMDRFNQETAQISMF